VKDKCEGFARKISAYQDGELPFEEKREIEKHLETCDQCSQLLSEYRRTASIMETVLSEVPGDKIDLDALWEEIEGNIKCGSSVMERLAKWIRKPVVLLPTAVAAAAAALLFVIIPFHGVQPPLAISRVESVYSSSGMVMVLKVPKSGQPLVWILTGEGKETGA
jgi:hypothetical protein